MTPFILNERTAIPGTIGIGPSSPVQHILVWLTTFLREVPATNLKNEVSRLNGALVATHILHLFQGCGTLNGLGLHSSAIALLRPLEDALDIFAAITLVPHAAEEWEAGNLKASEAAKQWTQIYPNSFTPDNMSLGDYRKKLREQFNDYSHCSRKICLWNLYFNAQLQQPPTEKIIGTVDLNLNPCVINSNAHSIDAHLTAHMLELAYILRVAYSETLDSIENARTSFNMLVNQIDEIMQNHNVHNCQDVRSPPELVILNQ